MTNKAMTMHDLKNLIDSMGPDEVILDVRAPAEYAEGHLPKSINIDHESVSKHVDELKKYKHVYIHCKAGGRATRAHQALAAHGLNNMVCIGSSGFDVWKNAGYPVVKGK